jgi:hypothetical protein
VGFFSPAQLAPLLAKATASGLLVDEWHYDEADDRMLLRQTQDVEPIFNANKEDYALDDGGGWTPSRDMRRMANIPNIIIEQWFREGINVYRAEDWPKVRAKLNSSEYLYLRTAPGRI